MVARAEGRSEPGPNGRGVVSALANGVHGSIVQITDLGGNIEGIDLAVLELERFGPVPRFFVVSLADVLDVLSIHLE